MTKSNQVFEYNHMGWTNQNKTRTEALGSFSLQLNENVEHFDLLLNLIRADDVLYQTRLEITTPPNILRHNDGFQARQGGGG